VIQQRRPEHEEDKEHFPPRVENHTENQQQPVAQLQPWEGAKGQYDRQEQKQKYR
jgi:hypothetical protein